MNSMVAGIEDYPDGRCFHCHNHNCTCNQPVAGRIEFGPSKGLDVDAMAFFFNQPKTAHKCPCCDGWGTRTLVNPPPDGTIYIETTSETTCPACGGSGVVWQP